eukprot:scaffold6781_cov74-Phaeocystis_antarctica.AAC.1
MQPDGTCELSYSKFHLHAIESSVPAAVQAARPEDMDSPPAEAHVPDCTIWYEYTTGGGGAVFGGGGDGGSNGGCGGGEGAAGGGDANTRL